MKIKDIQIKFINKRGSVSFDISPGMFYSFGGLLRRDYSNPFAIFYSSSERHYTLMKQDRKKGAQDWWNFNNDNSNDRYFYNRCRSLNVENLRKLKIID